MKKKFYCCKNYVVDLFRWFYLKNNKLMYSKRTGEDVTVMEEDLRICLVRPFTDIDRRFCFEIISPGKSHVLQADSEEIAKCWITTLQQGISTALHETMAESGTRSSPAATLKWEDGSDEEHEGGAKSKPVPRSETTISNSGLHLTLNSFFSGHHLREQPSRSF